VFLSSGRHVSVKSHRLDGGSITLVLPDGGEITFDQSLVTSIAPDEVPYPEPATEPPATAAAAAVPAVPYADLIDATAARHGVDPQLVRAVIQVESAYQPSARSRKGAMGLMQLMPHTARQYAVKNPYDPTANIEAGIRHLKTLLQRFELSVALAAYNAGIGAVERFGGIPPYQETREYVSRVLGLMRSHRPT
jgi:soluble lytic murein transglycosylase-like protein